MNTRVLRRGLTLAAVTGGIVVLAWIAAQTGETVEAQGPAAAAKPSAATLARGKYLVMVGGCHDCHTPWTDGPNGPEPDMSRMLQGHPASPTLAPPPAPTGRWIGASDDTNTAFAGPWGVSYTRNLTPDKETGLGAWTEQQFIETLRNGRHQGRGRQLLPPMPWQNYGKMTEPDLQAVFAYLRSIPAISNKVPDPVIAAAPAQ
jgi:mono/diheme cytochrome c family protein